MARTAGNGKSLKRVLKEALLETLQEQRDLLREVLGEAIEDLALVEAIREGRKTKPAARSEVFRILQGEQ